MVDISNKHTRVDIKELKAYVDDISNKLIGRDKI